MRANHYHYVIGRVERVGNDFNRQQEKIPKLSYHCFIEACSTVMSTVLVSEKLSMIIYCK